MKPGMTPKWTLMNILLPAAQDAIRGVCCPNWWGQIVFHGRWGLVRSIDQNMVKHISQQALKPCSMIPCSTICPTPLWCPSFSCCRPRRSLCLPSAILASRKLWDWCGWIQQCRLMVMMMMMYTSHQPPRNPSLSRKLLRHWRFPHHLLLAVNLSPYLDLSWFWDVVCFLDLVKKCSSQSFCFGLYLWSFSHLGFGSSPNLFKKTMWIQGFKLWCL